MALEDFISGRYSTGPVTPTGQAMAARGPEMTVEQELIDAVVRAGFAQESLDRQRYQQLLARSISFGISELPPTLRMEKVKGHKASRYDPDRSAVAFAAMCGVELPLDERTPAGVVADYIREHCPDNADTRALVRMFMKIQDTLDRRNAAQAEATP